MTYIGKKIPYILSFEVKIFFLKYVFGLVVESAFLLANTPLT